MKLARPSATWKKDLHINAVQKQRDQLRMKYTRTKQEKYGRDLGIFGISQKKKKKQKKKKITLQESIIKMPQRNLENHTLNT